MARTDSGRAGGGPKGRRRDAARPRGDATAGKGPVAARPGHDGMADPETNAAEFLAENDAWMFGPNCRPIVAILERLEEIGPKDGVPIADAWDDAPRRERDTARKLARKAVDFESDAERHLQMARESVGTWLAVAANRPEFLKADPDWARVSSRVAEAALDAITALILEADLDRSQLDVLSEPWTAAAGAVRGSTPRPAPDAMEAGEPGSPLADEDEGKFGPNSDAVVDLINRLWLLTPEQVARLVGGWQAAPAEDLRIAHEMLHDLVDENDEWRDQVRAAQESLAPWLNAGRIAETSGFLGQTGQADVRRMSGPALADAVAALVLADLLEPEDAQTLYGPWFELVGGPALPTTQAEEKDDASDSSAGRPPTGA